MTKSEFGNRKKAFVKKSKFSHFVSERMIRKLAAPEILYVQ